MNFSNDNKIKTAAQLKDMEKKVTQAIAQALGHLGIDTAADHNTHDTPHRIAKMWIHEKFKGRYTPPPKITVFPNVKKVDQLMTIGPINLKSTCSHHFVDFLGKCWIGILPGDKLIGLSKYARIVDWFARRPQIQEELTAQITHWIEENMKPAGVAVVIKAKHFCCCTRGVEDEHMEFVTAEVRGALRNNKSLKEEFYHQINFTK
ncbi:MAG: GTP cyclohydrolase I [Lactobacillales bacterium]|jgi:GTP cyclohydrolase I|nr:GTP cyclohydrolase I [Lactobacillales bacterium]